MVLSQFKEHCKTQADYEVDETMYYLGLEKNSYKAAFKGLGDFEKLMIGDDGGKETEDVSVYLELICHSYNDEMSKTMMSILALISLKIPILSFLLGYYSVATVEDTPQGAIDATSGNLSMLESIGKTVTNSGGALIVEMNNLYTIVSSIVNLFYVSYDTWIETVRITVFTDTHAHTCERWIHKSGELKGGQNTVGIYSKNDYISGDIGRGLKWEEEPGTYMRNLVHKGDNWEDGKEVNEEEGLRGEVPLY